MLSAQSSHSTARALQETAPLDYSMLTEAGEIASISSEWNALLARSRCNRAFSCSKWYLATPCILPELKPLVLVARRHGTLAGIFPVWLDPHRREAGFPDDHSDHLDIIAADDDMETITGLLSMALRGGAGYSRLSLKHIKPDSNCARGARELGLCPAMDEVFAPQNSLAYAVIGLARGYDEYMKNLSRKFRLNLNRMRSKAQREGVVVRELGPEDLSPESLPELFLALHESRFGKGTSLKSVCKSPEAWIRHLFPSLFAERRMRVFAVLHQDRIAGLDLATATRTGMYAWNGGFLPEIAHYEPGKLLIHKAIQQCCAEGLPEYDLGWFGQQYKAHWKPAIRYIGELQFNTHS
jgi:CelD/BcsL family acetyltransferase involved in cellulose biosynthesis